MTRTVRSATFDYGAYLCYSLIAVALTWLIQHHTFRRLDYNLLMLLAMMAICSVRLSRVHVIDWVAKAVVAYAAGIVAYAAVFFFNESPFSYRRMNQARDVDDWLIMVPFLSMSLLHYALQSGWSLIRPSNPVED